MANLTPKTISEFPAATSLGNDDVVPISASSSTKKVTGRALLDSWFRQGTALVAGNDLDNFKNPGSYYSSISTTSAAILNTPVTTQGYRLDVIITSSNAYPTQIAVCYNGDIYRRSLISVNDTPTWKPWERMLTESDVAGFPYTPFARLSNMTDNDQEHLLEALNADISAVPTGASIVVCGSSSNTNRCALFMLRLTASFGRAFSISPYGALNNIFLSLGSSGWSVNS